MLSFNLILKFDGFLCDSFVNVIDDIVNDEGSDNLISITMLDCGNRGGFLYRESGETSPQE